MGGIFGGGGGAPAQAVDQASQAQMKGLKEATLEQQRQFDEYQQISAPYRGQAQQALGSQLGILGLGGGYGGQQSQDIKPMDMTYGNWMGGTSKAFSSKPVLEDFSGVTGTASQEDIDRIFNEKYNKPPLLTDTGNAWFSGVINRSNDMLKQNGMNKATEEAQALANEKARQAAFDQAMNGYNERLNSPDNFSASNVDNLTQAITSMPGYDYARKQQEKALLRNAAATGQLGGGNVLKNLQEQNIAFNSAALSDYYNQLGAVSGTGLTGYINLANQGMTGMQNMANLNQQTQQSRLSSLQGLGQIQAQQNQSNLNFLGAGLGAAASYFGGQSAANQTNTAPLYTANGTGMWRNF